MRRHFRGRTLDVIIIWRPEEAKAFRGIRLCPRNVIRRGLERDHPNRKWERKEFIAFSRSGK